MRNHKKLLIALAVILIPAIGFGFNYFNWNQDASVSKQTLTVDGDMTVEDVSPDQKLVPGDMICDNIVFNVKSTAPSLLRVSVKTYDSDNGTIGDVSNQVSKNIGKIINLNGDWIDGGDGYYYYTKAVNTDTLNSETLVLFADGIKFEIGENLDANDYQDKYIHATISAEMIQAKYGVFESAWKVDQNHVAYQQLKTESDQVTEPNKQ